MKKKLEIHSKQVGKCVHPGTHIRTYGRTTRKHNASGPIDRMGRGVKLFLTIGLVHDNDFNFCNDYF